MHDRARGNYTHLYTFNRSTPSSPRWFGRLGHVLLVVSSPDQIDNQVAGYATVYAPPNAAHPREGLWPHGASRWSDCRRVVCTTLDKRVHLFQRHALLRTVVVVLS